MFLVELVLQGVRGIRDLARLRFQNGFNIVTAGNEAGKTTAIDTVQRLLFPSSAAASMTALVSKHAPDNSRAALVMCADDGTYYRIIQDFSKQAVNLSRYNAPKKDFTLLHKDWDSAVQFMTGLTTEDLSEEDFSKVYILRRDHFNERPAPAAAASAPLAAVPAAAAAAPSQASPQAAHQEKLAELHEALKKAEEAADAEYKAQSARLGAEELKKKFSALEESDAKKAELEASLAELKGCADLPANLQELIENYEQFERQKESEMDELRQELEGVTQSIAAAPAVNFMTDKLFIAGAVVGILSFVAVFIPSVTLQQEVFLGGLLVALVLMAIGWYQGSRKSAQRNAFIKERDMIENEIAGIEKRFAEQGAGINEFLQATGSANAAELRDKSDNYRYFSSMLNDLQEQRQRALGNFSIDELQQEYAARQQEAQDLDASARAVAQFNVDTYAIRKDIERIESEQPHDDTWGLSGNIQDFHEEFIPPVAPAGSGGIHDDIAIASRISGIEMETLIPALEAAAQRNLTAITNGRYVRVEVGHDGGPPVVHGKDDSAVPSAELSHGTRDLVYFCLRTGLIEALAGKQRLPFVLDDPLSVFDPERQKAAVQVLRALGTKTQVILFTSTPSLKAAGDAAAELK